MKPASPTFSGEVQLAAWSESHSGGCKVVLWLADPSDLDAFRALTVRKGNQAGHRFMAVLVEIGDDERPVQRDTTATGSNAAKGGAIAVLAGRLCADERFHEFVAAEYGVIWRTGHANEDIAQWMREQCSIDSRADLDHNEAAALRFHQIIRGPWQKYCQQKGWK